MRKYAEDVDIAPIELMIVVRTVICRFYGQLMVDLPVSFRACYDRYAGQELPLRATPWYRLPQLT